MIFKRIAVLLPVLFALFSSPQAFAEIIKTKQVGHLVYFLSQAPNKILVYDQAQDAFLEDIILSSTPTSFTVTNDYIYVGYDRVLKQIALVDETESFLRNSVAQIKELETLNSVLYMMDAEDTITAISLSDQSLIASDSEYYSTYKYNGLVVSPYRNEIFAIRDKSSLHRIPLNDDGSIANRYSAYYGINSNQLLLDPTESRLFTGDRKLLAAGDTTYLSESPEFERATFAQSNMVACFESTLTLYTPTLAPQKQFGLSKNCDLVTVYDSSIFVFSFSGSHVIANIFDISDEILLPVGSPLDPSSTDYHYELIEVGDDKVVYLYDRETLHIHRWSLESQSYLTSFVLRNPIVALENSLTANRLYVASAGGRVTYFKTDGSTGVEQDFAETSGVITAMVSSGHYLFTHNSYYLQSWQSDGTEISNLYEYHYGLQSAHFDETNSELVLLSSGKTNRFPVAADGSIGEDTQISFSQSNNNLLAVNTRENLVIYDNGKIMNFSDGYENGVLSSDIRSAAWINDQLVSINYTDVEIQFWSSSYELSSTLPLIDASTAEVFVADNKLLLVRQYQSPEFDHYEINNIPDTDDDGLHDLEDNCKHEGNADQLDTDLDLVGDACDPDDDNDGLPDSVELEHGLDKLDSSDALSDLDQDGFSNFLEHLQGSDLSDNSSLPSKLTAYSEDFENGWPAAFYVQDNKDWKLVSKSNGSLLESESLSASGESSSVFWGGYVATGVLTFKSNRYIHYYLNFEVFVNDEKADLGVKYLNSDENLYSLNLSEGAHIVEFRMTLTQDVNSGDADVRFIDDLTFALDSDLDGVADTIDNCPNIANRWQYDNDGDGKGDECDNTPWGNDRDNDDVSDWTDNCPDTYNPNQADLDSDGQGDACDNTDDRPQDHDNDGFYGSADNCPLVYNPDQNNLDQDYYGDACDSDIDGDGLDNIVEEKHKGLDPYDALDAYSDFDGDGASNKWEIDQGYDPDQAESHEVFNMYDYFPLGDIEYVYADDATTRTLKIRPLEQPNRYEFDYDGEVFQTLESREDGIYLISTSYSFTEATVTCTDALVFPARLSMGGYFYKEGSCEYDAGDYSNNIRINTKVELIDTEVVTWKDQSYSSVTLRNLEGYYDNSYAFGIGELSYAGMPLVDMTVGQLDRTFTSSDNDSSDDDSKGIGSYSLPFLIVLAVLSLARIQRGKLRTY